MSTTVSLEGQQLNRYMESRVSKDDKKIDPFEFLAEEKNEFPDLTLTACKILATPASSASVERIFSSGGEVTRGKRNRLTNHNLE